ncbi:MAG: undecaprenyldiphospho-muramoylpentapeptide beta-N-acetylglucosaminyltransferase [candidate division KSB1 bacterium]|nr:undecaprenyldiphospho-muramoylpentapeptide beta-N-acetylglucosaminyltransferase [candidate division KSB1 bacterium]
MVQKNKKAFVFTGGGTGGHLYPALALAQEVKRRMPAAEIHFIGSRRGLEARVVPTMGFALHLIPVRGFQRRLSIANLAVPWLLLQSLVQSFVLLRRIAPAAVIGTGGYVSGPVLVAARFLGLPTLIQEQNSLPGATTRILARIVDRVHISFAESAALLKARSVRLTGNPVRSFDPHLAPESARLRLGLEAQRPTLLIFGGSQGARALNDALLGALPRLLSESEVQIIWSTGKSDYPRIRAEVQDQPRINVLEFIDDMEAAYRAADLAVTRSGALTLAELTVCGVPAILVPYPFAAAGHQEQNARALERLGAAVVILQRDLTSERLAEEVLALLRDHRRREEMANAARKAAFPNATREIVDSLFELIAEELKDE